MSDKAVFEGDAATQLGVSRDVLIDLRNKIPLVKGKHWRYGQNRRVYVKPAGLALITEALEKSPKKAPPAETPQNASEAPDVDSANKETPAAQIATSTDAEAQESTKSQETCPPPKVVESVIVNAVVSNTPRNRKILECRSKDVDGPVIVRVQDNRKWVPGMKLKARKAIEIPSLWYLEGRSPRQKGKM